MPRNFVCGRVRVTPRTAIYAIRIKDERIDPIEAGDTAERMREKMLSRGEVATEIVVVEGAAKETLRLHGPRHAGSRVRDAMFNAAISWQPIELD
jgi:hypothetical protein